MPSPVDGWVYDSDDTLLIVSIHDPLENLFTQDGSSPSKTGEGFFLKWLY